MMINDYILSDLQRLQNISARIILLANNGRYVKAMHSKLHLLMLKDRREIHLSQLCHESAYETPKHSLNRFIRSRTVTGNLCMKIMTYDLCLKTFDLQFLKLEYGALMNVRVCGAVLQIERRAIALYPNSA